MPSKKIKYGSLKKLVASSDRCRGVMVLDNDETQFWARGKKGRTACVFQSTGDPRHLLAEALTLLGIESEFP